MASAQSPSTSGVSRVSDDIRDEGPLVSAARQTENFARVGVNRLKGAMEVPTEYVKENPMKSVVIALGVGAMLGFLIGSRRNGR
jgi:ElaB/YqjD/DUF883 family membrane-anchored ribosome-binding protein